MANRGSEKTQTDKKNPKESPNPESTGGGWLHGGNATKITVTRWRERGWKGGAWEVVHSRSSFTVKSDLPHTLISRSFHFINIRRRGPH